MFAFVMYFCIMLLHHTFTFFGFRTANCAYKAIGRPYIY